MIILLNIVAAAANAWVFADDPTRALCVGMAVLNGLIALCMTIREAGAQ